MKGNELIIKEVHELDINNLDGDQLRTLASNIISKLNVKKLEEDIVKTIIHLSNVGSPSFGADVKTLLNEDEKRLNLINQLANNLQHIKSYTHNFRYNKYGCRENDDHIYAYVHKVKDLIDSIINYGEFEVDNKIQEEKYIKQLNGEINETKLLQ